MFFAEKDPDSVLDYSIDWSAWLDTDAISVSTWSVSPAGGSTALDVDSDSATTTVATVWLSGGDVGQDYIVTNHITTAAGREDDRSIMFTIGNK